MDAAERQLKILLKLAADTSGAQAVKAELKSVEAQAAQTAGSWERLAAATGKSVEDLRAAGQARIKAATAQIGVTGELTQQQVIEERLQVIAATRFALAEAIATGDRAQADLLRGELGIRTATLGVMRAETLTQAELNKLTTNEEALLGKLATNAAATAASGLLAGANLGKARAEAITLAREWAAGSLNTRTIGAFLGSWGPALTVAGIAGYSLFEAIHRSLEETIEFNKELDKMIGKVIEQSQHWHALARDAKDAKDLHGLTTAIVPELNQLAAKLKEIRERELTGWEWFFDHIGRFAMMPLTGGNIPSSNQQKYDQQGKSVELLERQATKAGEANIKAARAAATEWERVKILPVAEALSIYNEKIEENKRKQAETNISTADGQKELNKLLDEAVSLEEKRTILQGRTREVTQFEVSRLSELRQQQELINANPELGPDERTAQLHNLYLKERMTLLSEIVKLTALIKTLEESGTDEKLIGPLRKELQDVNFEVDKLNFKIKETGSFSDQLGVSMHEWVSSFGTAAQQVGKLIQGTINAGLEGTNQLLLDAAFRTGDWHKTLLGVERQILNLFLTFIEHQIESFILGETQKTTATATSLGQAAALAAGYAPAAAGSSIATGGTTAIIGEIAAVAAIAAIIAALTGAFRKGGVAGEGGPGLAVIGEEGPEFVFTAGATRNIGADNLYSMMHAAERAPRFGSGGRVNYPGLFPGNDIEPRWLPGADLPNDFFTGNTGGGGPIIDFGFGERPIFRWPYGGPHHGGYIVESGVTIYPSDDDAPPFTVVDANGLPIGPGIDPNEPIIGLPGEPNVFVPRHAGFTPGGGLTIIPTAGAGFPVSRQLPWWATFNPSLGRNFDAVAAGQIDLYSGRTNWNASRGQWEQYDPATQTFVAVPGPAPIDFGGAPPVAAGNIVPPPVLGSTFFDYASGLPLTVTGFDPGTGTTFYRDGSGNSYARGPRSARENLPGGATGTTTPAGSHWDFTRGRYVTNDFAGGAQFDPHAANLLQMWFNAYGGTPNDTGTTTDEGHTIFQNPGTTKRGYFDPDEGWIIPRGADGMRLAGPASRADNILAWLSTGERVVPANRNIMLEQAFGFDWDKRLELAMPRLADGGRVAAGVSPAGSQKSAAEGDVHVYIFNDEAAARRAFNDSPAGRKVFKRFLEQNRR